MWKAFLLIFTYFFNSINGYEVIYAVNAGGGEFSDINNIKYESDPLEGIIGTASDFGLKLKINRVPEWDAYLYQTERYHTQSFYYDIPVEMDGDYALVLKFCEVYFNAPNMKVFDVVLNKAHTIVNKLDLFSEVGNGVAHDEIIRFSILRGYLHFKNEKSKIRDGSVRVEFVKTIRDNPKVNALILFKGDADDLENIPKLPPLDEVDENLISDSYMTPDSDDSLIDMEHTEEPRIRKTSGPKQTNPYALDDSTVMLPVIISIGAFIPLLFCLCKL